MNIQGRKVAILVEDDFEDVELTEPRDAMKGARAEVVIVGSGTKDTYTGKHGAKVRADVTPREVNVRDFDALVIPGGYAPDKMRLHQDMVDLVKRFAQEGKLVAAVCHGPQMLISAELVKGKKVTSWPSVSIDLKNAGAQFVDQPVVEDGNLITSRKPDDLPQFSQAIIDRLSKEGGREQPPVERHAEQQPYS